MRFPNVVVILSAFALTWVLPLAGQSPNGVLNGLVVDPSNREPGCPGPFFPGDMQFASQAMDKL
jgi:hypothetical protein